MKVKERIYWLDVVRVVAIISITLNHAVNRTYDNYANTLLEAQTFSSLSIACKTLVSVFSRIGVPLFLMISGVLLLDKKIENDKDVKIFYKRNWLGLFITSEIWYFIMYWFIAFFRPYNSILNTDGIGEAINNSIWNMLFINQITLGSMWYIPMILCIYLLIPWIAIVVKKLSPKMMMVPVVLAIWCGMIVPNINAFLKIEGIEFYMNSAITIGNLFSLFLVYVLMGYYVGKTDVLKAIPTRFIFLLMLITYILCCGFQYYAYIGPTNYLVSYDFLGILICAVFLFEFIKRIANYLLCIKNIIIYVSKISFGIYFVHIIIMELLNWYVDLSMVNRPIKLVLLEMISVTGSILVIWIVSKNPTLKKYLFMIKD